MGESGGQLKACLNGMPEAGWSARLSDQTMTPLEMVNHLTECYQAFNYLAANGEHYKDWGSYEGPTDANEAQARMWAEREKAGASVTADSSDEVLSGASGYISHHDAYHIGQLAAIRMMVDPDWNPYAMYE
jgi:hypothetical protein